MSEGVTTSSRRDSLSLLTAMPGLPHTMHLCAYVPKLHSWWTAEVVRGRRVRISTGADIPRTSQQALTSQIRTRVDGRTYESQMGLRGQGKGVRWSSCTSLLLLRHSPLAVALFTHSTNRNARKLSTEDQVGVVSGESVSATLRSAYRYDNSLGHGAPRSQRWRKEERLARRCTANITRLKENWQQLQPPSCPYHRLPLAP